MGYVLGIDPGINGAIGVVDGNGFVCVEDLPVLETYKSGKTKSGKRKIRRELDIETFAVLLIKYVHEYSPDLIVIENVQSMPGQGIAGAFSFGQTFGRIEGVVRALSGVRSIYVTPQSWKKYHGILRQAKDASILKSRLLYPAEADMFLKSKDGRADAVLIAEYGLSLNLISQ